MENYNYLYAYGAISNNTISIHNHMWLQIVPIYMYIVTPAEVSLFIYFEFIIQRN